MRWPRSENAPANPGWKRIGVRKRRVDPDASKPDTARTDPATAPGIAADLSVAVGGGPPVPPSTAHQGTHQGAHRYRGPQEALHFAVGTGRSARSEGCD